MLARRWATRAGWLWVLLGAGCGGGGGADPPPEAPPPLTAQERRLVLSYEERIGAHCVRVSRALVDPARAPTARQEAAAFAAADELLALARAKPHAEVQSGQDLRLFVSDVVENLEGSNCDPRMLGRLARGLRDIPRG